MHLFKYPLVVMVVMALVPCTASAEAARFSDEVLAEIAAKINQTHEADEFSGVVLVAPVDSLIASIERNPYHEVTAMPVAVMRISADNARARLVVYFHSLNGNTREGVRSINYVNADCFVTIK